MNQTNAENGPTDGKGTIVNVESVSVSSFDEAEHKRIVRRVDWHLLPLVTLLYFLSFLDRGNIGNAKIAGMAADAHLDGLKYNLAAVFFVPYALAEIPSNILLKLVRPSRWIPFIMVAWGLIMTLMCLCKTYHDLIIARVFLGLAEGGLFPGISFYLSIWYRRCDLSSRIAIFFSAATIAGAFGGLLARVKFCIEKMEGVGGLHGWQWIFGLEGMATVLCSIAAFFLMQDYPDSVTFLTETQKIRLLHTLREDTQGAATHFDMKFVWQALRDYKSWVQVFTYMGNAIAATALSLFLPTIIEDLGLADADAQLLTIPPFVCGCISTILIGLLSDRLNLRGPFILSGSVIALAGCIVLYTQNAPGPSYFGTFLIAIGAYPPIPLNISWAMSNAGGEVKKGVVVAMIIGSANLGGICASFVYITPPRFYVGHGIIMGWLGLSILCSLFAMWNFKRLNREKEGICQEKHIDESRSAEFAEMGSESPLFRFSS
ncbi:MFS general substrate transporter [Schizophyllum commune H4-8]|uniref:MFS general substrate transporter n=1 Tax=Schizophyllum commune (strain H4-8 / FGSC 9210) TaxID=578458 RepID=UPI00215E6441|nr:MFS general substrate transporter [Schizophyllum commune H4-8]KAI5897004.1 MFS general substrate transporter [Schizophyllum commune H4-8]